MIGRAEIGAALQSTGEERFLFLGEVGRILDVNDSIVHGSGMIEKSMIRGFVHVLGDFVRFVRRLGVV